MKAVTKVDVYYIYMAVIAVYTHTFKGLVHPKIKISTVITHPHVVPTP